MIRTSPEHLEIGAVTTHSDKRVTPPQLPRNHASLRATSARPGRLTRLGITFTGTDLRQRGRIAIARLFRDSASHLNL